MPECIKIFVVASSFLSLAGMIMVFRYNVLTQRHQPGANERMSEFISTKK